MTKDQEIQELRARNKQLEGEVERWKTSLFESYGKHISPIMEEDFNLIPEWSVKQMEVEMDRYLVKKLKETNFEGDLNDFRWMLYRGAYYNYSNKFSGHIFECPKCGGVANPKKL